jgi:phenylpyruvate tautomerase PptA (4-oxalocrotonate tautomerase family)
MPFYEITHSYPLTPTQRQLIAERITDLHSTTFNAPSLFVNINFSPITSSEDYFYGGKRRPNTNRIFAHVRSGPSRSSKDFDRLAEDIDGIWDDVVGLKEGDSRVGNEKVLQCVFVVPGITAREEGFAIPPAGQEGAWFKENWSAFKARADAGDEDFIGLLEEVERRPELLKKGDGDEEKDAAEDLNGVH